ncbi:mCG53020, isoform CRA_b [Mus musculus]|nr:mCG53020, isoform CRA_b [Mus musculus]
MNPVGLLQATRNSHRGPSGMLERPAFCTGGEHEGEEVLHPGVLTTSHTGKRMRGVVAAPLTSSQDWQDK